MRGCARSAWCCLLAENQIFGGGTAIAPLNQFVLDLLAFLQGFLACPLDGRDMNENVLPTIRWCNEPVTLSGVEPLHDSASHSALNASYRDKDQIPPSTRYPAENAITEFSIGITKIVTAYLVSHDVYRRMLWFSCGLTNS